MGWALECERIGCLLHHTERLQTEEEIVDTCIVLYINSLVMCTVASVEERRPALLVQHLKTDEGDDYGDPEQPSASFSSGFMEIKHYMSCNAV